MEKLGLVRSINNHSIWKGPNSIHTQSQILTGISTQNGSSNFGAYFICNILVIGIQDLYISK